MTSIDLDTQRDDLMKWAGLVFQHDSMTEIEEVAKTPHSHVLKFTAGAKTYYLKKTPPALYLEVGILKLLDKEGQGDHLPSLVATNKKQSCFILKSCGTQTLRQFFGRDLGTLQKIGLLVQGIERYIAVQEAASSHIQEFMAAGALDWRLDKLPGLYEQFVDEDGFLRQFGLSETECRQLQNKKDGFSSACEQLAAFNMPDSLNHSDFQENNMVVDLLTEKVTLIDWGEVTVGNPLLSLASCFKKLFGVYGLDAKSEAYLKLHATLFNHRGLSQQDMRRALELAFFLENIYYLLTLKELVANTGGLFPHWAERVQRACRIFINTMV